MKQVFIYFVAVLLITPFISGKVLYEQADIEDGGSPLVFKGGGTTDPPECHDYDIVTTYSYNDRNWVTGIKIDNIAENIGGIQYSRVTHEEEYEYDSVGNLNYLSDFVRTQGLTKEYKKTQFGYDNLNRLTSATGVLDGQTDPLQKAGRYFDTLSFGYDKVGNIKNNYELEYCYNQGASTVCGDSITNPTNNQLQKVRPKGGVYGNFLETTYTYDPYGNMQSESSWQEIPVGDVEYWNGNLHILLNGNVESGENVRILFYHEDNPVLSGIEHAAFTSQPATVYSGTKSPYWDNDPTYTHAVPVLSANMRTGSVLVDTADFFDAGGGYRGVPFIKQYFRAYKEKTTTYCWDYANRMTNWFDDEGNCMEFGYDHSGNRIKKVVGSSANKVLNPSFEVDSGIDYLPGTLDDSVGGNNMPDGWKMHAAASRDASQHYSGSYSLKLYLATPSRAYSSQDLPIEQGKKYMVSGMVKTQCTDSNCYGTIVTQCRDKDHDAIWSNCGLNSPNTQKIRSPTWTEVSYGDLVADNENAAFIRVLCYHTPGPDGTNPMGAGTVWCDDMKLVDLSGDQTIYITQGNNVIYEEQDAVDFECPSSCSAS